MLIAVQMFMQPNMAGGQMDDMAGQIQDDLKGMMGGGEKKKSTLINQPVHEA